MSHHRVSREDILLVRGLHKRGIPIDECELKRMETECLGLRIQEDYGSQSMAFNLANGGAGYVFEVVIWNDSNRPLMPMHIGFEGPDWEPRMRLLSDPHKQYPARQGKNRRRLRDHHGYPIDYSVVRNTYFFPPDRRIGHPREFVLNHMIGRRCVVYPGESLEGLLLGVGERPIPPGYRERDRLRISLTIFDERRRSHKSRFQPMVNSLGVGIASGDDAAKTIAGPGERN